MDKQLQKQLQKQQRKLEKKMDRFLHTKEKKNNQMDDWVENLEKKIPPALKNTLNVAFYKGFQVVFEKGSGVIEKTYSKEKMAANFEINDYTINKRLVNRGLRNIDGKVFQTNAFNSCATFAEGVGFGILGIGLPDIPIFIGMLLKGIYETAIHYGFDYEAEQEKIWILLMIRASLSNDNLKAACHKEVEVMCNNLCDNKEAFFDFDIEMKKTAEVLADAMLLLKFVQGLPIVGIIGSVGNFSIYQRVSKYANLQYKTRYLSCMKLEDKK